MAPRKRSAGSEDVPAAGDSMAMSNADCLDDAPAVYLPSAALPSEIRPEAAKRARRSTTSASAAPAAAAPPGSTRRPTQAAPTETWANGRDAAGGDISPGAAGQMPPGDSGEPPSRLRAPGPA